MKKINYRQNYLDNLSDIPEQYQNGYKVAVSIIDWEKLLEQLYFSSEQKDVLLPFIRKMLLAAVIWTEKFSTDTEIQKIELLRSGLESGLFALQCTGMRNFSWIEWQIKNGIRSFINTKENKCEKPQNKVKTVSAQPEKCPFCGSDDIKEIVYGMPSIDFDYSRYISGGCCVMPDSPKWHCDNCFAKFIRKKLTRKRSK